MNNPAIEAEQNTGGISELGETRCQCSDEVCCYTSNVLSCFTNTRYIPSGGGVACAHATDLHDPENTPILHRVRSALPP